jgi:hypothetical protein
MTDTLAPSQGLPSRFTENDRHRIGEALRRQGSILGYEPASTDLYHWSHQNRDWLDLGRLHGAFRLSQTDLDRAESVETTARRCLTVDNEASFHELAKLRSGALLLQTRFPGSATLALLKQLPEALEFHHFGDSDEAGFEILRDLRERSGRNFQPLHMERGRLPAEQEALGAPRDEWPFYPATGSW